MVIQPSSSVGFSGVMYMCICVFVFVYLDVIHLGTLFLRSSIFFSKIYHIIGLFRVFLLESYKWDWMGWDWDGLGWDLCVGLLYEHRFAVQIIPFCLLIISGFLFLFKMV